MSRPSRWQKVLGGEGGHGVLILGPRAVERLESYTPAWPLPKVFRLVSKGKLTEGVFKGETINTPSMLAVEDAIFALEWAQGARRARRADRALATPMPPRSTQIVAERDWLGHLAADPAIALEDQRLPDGRGRRRGVHQDVRRRCSRRKARPTTSPAIAMPRRACASGAARPSTPPISRRSARGSTGPTRPLKAA